MRWGSAVALGPFELWAAFGVPETVERMRRDACAIPESVERMLASGAQAFYADADREGEPGTRYFDLLAGGDVDLEQRPDGIVLRGIKRARGVGKSQPRASLVDLGAGGL